METGEAVAVVGKKRSSAEVVVLDVAEQRRRPVELAVATAKATVVEDAVPGLADDGCVDQVSGLLRRDADEDLLDELLWQRRGHVAVRFWLRRRWW